MKVSAQGHVRYMRSEPGSKGNCPEERCQGGPHIFAYYIEDLEGSGGGWVGRQLYKFEDGAWVDLTLKELKPGIIGRERSIIDALTRLLHRSAKQQHNYTPTQELPRGSWFEVQIVGDDGEPTGHVTRVTVELDRFEST